MPADTNVFTYEMRDDGTVTITGYQGAETALDIPSTVDNYVVSAIADHAFDGKLGHHQRDPAQRSVGDRRGRIYGLRAI